MAELTHGGRELRLGQLGPEDKEPAGRLQEGSRVYITVLVCPDELRLVFKTLN